LTPPRSQPSPPSWPCPAGPAPPPLSPRHPVHSESVSVVACVCYSRRYTVCACACACACVRACVRACMCEWVRACAIPAGITLPMTLFACAALPVRYRLHRHPCCLRRLCALLPVALLPVSVYPSICLSVSPSICHVSCTVTYPVFPPCRQMQARLQQRVARRRRGIQRGARYRERREIQREARDTERGARYRERRGCSSVSPCPMAHPVRRREPSWPSRLAMQ
jgi:hypothetical protein